MRRRRVCRPRGRGVRRWGCRHQRGLYLTRLASRVVPIEALPHLTATAVLQARAKESQNLVVRCGERVTSTVGDDHVEGIMVVREGASQPEMLSVDGVLVHISLDPDTGFLDGVVPLDAERRIIVNEQMEREVPGILAAGDVRSGSLGEVAAAVGDGAIAGISAQRLLQKWT